MFSLANRTLLCRSTAIKFPRFNPIEFSFPKRFASWNRIFLPNESKSKPLNPNRVQGDKSSNRLFQDPYKLQRLIVASAEEISPLDELDSPKTVIAFIPKEQPIEDHYSIHYGFSQEYREKFARIYNQLIEQDRAYLMHPNNRDMLKEYLLIAFPSMDLDLFAERLITYRCYGYCGLKINELNREIDRYQEERKDLDGKELERVDYLINHNKYRLERAHIEQSNALKLLGKKAEDFLPGDFSMTTDPVDRLDLTNAYQAIKELGVWDFFD